MKKVLLLFLLFVTIESQAQSLKGVTLGEKVHTDGETTVAGFKGLLEYESLQDGTVAAIYFYFYSKSFKSDNLLGLREKVENYYKIKLQEITDDHSQYYECSKKGVYYYLSLTPAVQHEGFSCCLLIGDEKLMVQFDEEREELEITDF